MVADLERMPAAGRDYPGTWQAFEAWFPDDETCAAFLERLRWPDGFVCPACGHQGAWVRSAPLSPSSMTGPHA